MTCKQNGGWTVTWTVINSETISETITASNRTSVLPVGTVPDRVARRRPFTETVTTKPTAATQPHADGQVGP